MNPADEQVVVRCVPLETKRAICMPNQLEVLVVGAGIAGLAAAVALECEGMSVDVIERSSESLSGGAGLFLPGNSVRALTALGVGKHLSESGAPVPGRRLMNQRGRVPADIDMAELWRGTAGCVGITRGDLHAALQDIVRVPVRHGSPCTRSCIPTTVCTPTVCTWTSATGGPAGTTSS